MHSVWPPTPGKPARLWPARVPTTLRRPALLPGNLLRNTLLLPALILGLCLPLPVAAWSARKAPRPQSHRPHHGGHLNPIRSSHGPEVAVVAGRLVVTPRRALAALKAHVAAREMAEAVQIAEALVAARRVARSVLADAAAALGSGNDYPVQLRLWQRAGRTATPSTPFSEGYLDALLAAGDVAAARAVLDQALVRLPLGRRRPALERLVVVARLDGSTSETIERLRRLRDPDAAVLAAQLLEEQGDDDDAVEEMATAWQRFPGHRALQSSYQALLVRLGRREELSRVVKQAVQLAPADPLPWLAVLDAHITARDGEAARALIDDLAQKYRKNDVLLEALIDREQRLGDAPKRLEALYQALVTAAPTAPQYVEAWAEWLLARTDGRPGDAEAAAMAVLARLTRPPIHKAGADEWPGLEKTASLLLNHNRLPAARRIAETMAQKRPGDARALRLLALLDEREKRTDDASARWLLLTRLPHLATPVDRQRATEARLALAALLRGTLRLQEMTAQLRAQIDAGRGDRADVLLWLDLQQQQDDARDTLSDADWQRTAERGRRAFADDDEIAQTVAAGLLARGRLHEALPAIEALAGRDRDAATALVTQAVELALGRAEPALAKRLEDLLLATAEAPQATVLLRLGDLHLRLGDSAGATSLYRQAAQGGGHDTRAVTRLATLFRLAGAASDEDKALREIVASATDGDELEAAGQRLLAVALGAGRLGEVVRWLDTILPQHARREWLGRLRMTGYDLWLRAMTVEKALGRSGPEPAASGVGDALASGDLALQVKALRQLAELHRGVPLAVAKQLLAAPNPTLRRDVVLLLGASGTAEAAQLLVAAMDGHDVHVDGGMDPDEEVRAAQLAALALLPPIPGEERALFEFLQRGDMLAALVLGRVAGPHPALMRLSDVAVSTKREAVPYALLALGELAGRFGEEPAARDAADKLALFGPARPGVGDFPRQAAALWALAATGQAAAADELWQTVLLSPERPLRQMAVRLLAAPKPPRLVVPELHPGDGDTGRDMKNRIFRATLLPWLGDDPAALAAALGRVDRELAEAARHHMAKGAGEAWRQAWCPTWGPSALAGAALAGPAVREVCGER